MDRREDLIVAIARLESKVDHLDEQIKTISAQLNVKSQQNGAQDVAIARLEERLETFENERKTRFKRELAVISAVVALISAFIQILPMLF